MFVFIIMIMIMIISISLPARKCALERICDGRTILSPPLPSPPPPSLPPLVLNSSKNLEMCCKHTKNA